MGKAPLTLISYLLRIISQLMQGTLSVQHHTILPPSRGLSIANATVFDTSSSIDQDISLLELCGNLLIQDCEVRFQGRFVLRDQCGYLATS